MAIPDDAPGPSVAVSATMRGAKVRAHTEHTTVGHAQRHPDGRVTITCACGMTLTNGPTWSVDEHIRLHRAEARFLALDAVAPPGIPRLVTLTGQDRDPHVEDPATEVAHPPTDHEPGQRRHGS